jgi:hypothetical protein
MIFLFACGRPEASNEFARAGRARSSKRKLRIAFVAPPSRRLSGGSSYRMTRLAACSSPFLQSQSGSAFEMRHQKLSSGLDGVGAARVGFATMGSGVFRPAFTTGPQFRGRGRGRGIGEGFAVAMTTLDAPASGAAGALVLPDGIGLLAAGPDGLDLAAGEPFLAMDEGGSGRRTGRGADAIRWELRRK